MTASTHGKQRRQQETNQLNPIDLVQYMKYAAYSSHYSNDLVQQALFLTSKYHVLVAIRCLAATWINIPGLHTCDQAMSLLSRPN